MQTNIEAILKEINAGKRTPLNHVCLPYTEYLGLATWMKGVDNYVISSEQYMNSVDEEYNKYKTQGKSEPLEEVQ